MLLAGFRNFTNCHDLAILIYRNFVRVSLHTMFFNRIVLNFYSFIHFFFFSKIDYSVIFRCVSGREAMALLSVLHNEERVTRTKFNILVYFLWDNLKFVHSFVALKTPKHNYVFSKFLWKFYTPKRSTLTAILYQSIFFFFFYETRFYIIILYYYNYYYYLYRKSHFGERSICCSPSHSSDIACMHELTVYEFNNNNIRKTDVKRVT